MLLFGHRFVASEKFYHILDTDALVHTPPNSTVYIVFEEGNLDIIAYLTRNNIPFALEIATIEELIYAAALHASYIFVPKELAKTAQNIAENYLFDAKIIVHITSEEEITTMALSGVDGVAFPSAVIKINA